MKDDDEDNNNVNNKKKRKRKHNKYVTVKKMSDWFFNTDGMMERQTHINVVLRKKKEMTGRRENEEDLFFCTFKQRCTCISMISS